MTNNTTDNLWELTIPITGAGQRSAILSTQNKFVDKNIVIYTSTTAAGAATLNITDKETTALTVGTLNSTNHYYPMSTSLTGQMTFANDGWITTAGASATDSSVTVGNLAQSSLKLGSGSVEYVSTKTVTPNPTSNQTLTISAGYYNEARTITINAMSSGTKAVASTTATATNKTPTLTSTSSAVGSKIQISPSGDLQTNSGNLAGTVKYYMAFTAGAQALANSDFTKTAGVSTAGYLGGTGTTTQITPTASVAANNQLYYIPLTTGSVQITASKAATTPTVENRTIEVSGKTQLAASPSTATSGISTYYMAVKAIAPATSLSGSNVTKTVTAGYVGTDEVTVGTITTSASNNTYYIPIASGSLHASSGIVSANKGTLASITESATQPTSGFYFTATGSGTVDVNAEGWIAANTTQTSNTLTKYYTIPTATFTVAGNVVKSNTAGYIGADTSVGTITTQTPTVSATDPGSSYAANTSTIVPTGGYLVLPAGYYAATKISLATLIPDEATLTASTNIQMRQGYSAYDINGNLIAGAMPEYDGTYTLS